MSELPGYFEYLKDQDREPSNMFSFAYDDSISSFLISNKVFSAASFDPYTFSKYAAGIGDGDGLIIDDIRLERLILPPLGDLIGCPLLHEWIRENPDRVQNETPKIMYKLFTSLVENPEEIPEEAGGHMGFDARVREDGAVTLQVFGNCACMGVGQHTHFVQGMEVGFGQYDLHNADSQVQRTSLYAGLGHIAFLAEKRDPAQAQLF